MKNIWNNTMRSIIDFFNKKVIPVLDKSTKNAWIRGLYQSKVKLFPMVIVGTGVSMYMVVQSIFPTLPSFDSFRMYTSGLISLFMVYMIPYYVLTNKGRPEHRLIAGCTGISMYMIFTRALESDVPMNARAYFGSEGMLVAIIAGIYTAAMFLIFSKHILSKKILVKLPEMYQSSMVAILPILMSILIPWIIVIVLKIDVFEVLVSLILPIQKIAQSPIGFIILVFLPVVLYSMGISNWILKPITNPVVMSAIAMNVAGSGNNIFTNETLYAYINLGGMGATLGLVFLLMRSKSKKLRALGYTSILPAVLNIGEPVSYGLVVWNPTMMVPMWINAILLPTITYIFVKLGLAPIPVVQSTQTFIPIGISAVLLTKSIFSLVLVAVNLAVSTFVWYPFFKSVEEKVLLANDSLSHVSLDNPPSMMEDEQAINSTNE